MVSDEYGADTEEFKIAPISETRPEIKAVLDAWQELIDPAFKTEDQKPASDIPKTEIPVFEPPKPPMPQRKPLEPELPEPIPSAVSVSASHNYSISPGTGYHGKISSEAQLAITFLNADAKRLEKLVEGYEADAKDALRSSNYSLAQRYAVNIAQQRAKLNELRQKICDLGYIAVYASEQAHAKDSRKLHEQLGKYANARTGELKSLEMPAGYKLREASNGLAAAQDAKSASMESFAESAYISDNASGVLEEVMAEMEAGNGSGKVKGKEKEKNGYRI